MTREQNANTMLKLAIIVNYFEKFSVDDLKEVISKDTIPNEETISNSTSADTAISAIYDKILKTGHTPDKKWHFKYRAAGNQF